MSIDVTSKVDPKSSVSEPLRPCVRFNPGLSDQRQIFLLGILRKYRPNSVLDIGCGEGSLLEAACRPSFALPVSPDFDSRHDTNPNASNKSPEDLYGSLNINRVAGLDISEDLLRRVIDAVKVMDDPSSFNRWSRPRPRWSALEIKLWNGGIQHFNPELRNYEVMLSSEVIEHLPEDVLDCFCPMILGRYAPRVLAITTPGFEFNQLFTLPQPDDAPTQGVREGYLDPTGRTQRIFRHHDHKFEWTRSEFREWCSLQALTWGYSVEISGLGRSVVRDPWERDEPNGPPNEGEARLFASQTAVFIRLLDTAESHRDRYDRRAVQVIQEISIKDNSQEVTGHMMFAEHTLERHPSLISQQPSLTNEAILEEVKRAVTESCSLSSPGEAEIWDIWNIDAVSLACGGNLGRLYEALEAGGIGNAPESYDDTDRLDFHHPKVEWTWIEPKKGTRWTRRMRWNHYLNLQNNVAGWGYEDSDVKEPLETPRPGWGNEVVGIWEDTQGWDDAAKFSISGVKGNDYQEGLDSWRPR